MRFILGIIFIAISLGLFFGYTNPKYQGTQSLRDEVARFDEALNRANELATLRDELSAKYNSFSEDELRQLNTLLPDSIDTVRLIIDVDHIADIHDLTLLNISVAGGGESSGPDTNSFGTMYVTFNVSTSYEQFKVFLADLERSLRILDVDTISFGQPDALGRTTYSVRAKTYWLR